MNLSDSFLAKSCNRGLSRRRFLTTVATLPIALSSCHQSSADKRIVVIPKGMTHEFWQSIHRGAQRAAEDLRPEGVGLQIIWDGPLRERDITEQISIVDRRVATGVDGMVLAPQHSKIMSACVRRAHDFGVPVVVIDSGLADEDAIVKYVATDNYHGGWLAAAHLAATLAAEGKMEPNLILIRYQVGSESTERREQGFVDYFDPAITRPRPGPLLNVRWLSENQYAGATRDSASRAAAPIIQQYAGQVDAIFAPNESSATGTLDALRSQGLNTGTASNAKRVHLMGFDSSKPLLQAIADGDVDGSIIQDPYKMGYVGVTTIARHLQGVDVNQHRRQIVRSTGEHLVTRQNLGDIETVKRFDPQMQAARDMLRELDGEASA